MNTFSNLEIYLTDRLNNLLSTYISIFSSKVILLFQLGVPVLVLYYGYSIMMPGGSRATIQDMMFNLVRIAIVFAFVQNSSGLLDLSIGFIHELKVGFIEKKSLFALLDEQFLVTQQLGEDLFNLDTAYIKLQGLLASAMVWFGALFVFATSAIVFIAAEVSLVLLIVTSPIFIGCLTYGFTRELFNGWLRSIFSCIITLIFATLVVRIGIDINKEMLTELIVSPAKNNLLTVGAISLGMGIIISSLVLVATKLAGNIAGVAATSAIQGGMMLGAKAGIVGTGVAAGAATKYLGDKVRKLFSRSNNKHEGTKSNTLKEQSQKASFARVQQENTQD